MNPAVANFSMSDALSRLRERYAALNPGSSEAHRRALAVLPGGNTRSVLHFDPFPLRMARGKGAEVWDIDGHRYLDCVGEFSAGLYGHSDPVIAAAIEDALARGTAPVGGDRLAYPGDEDVVTGHGCDVEHADRSGEV